MSLRIEETIPTSPAKMAEYLRRLANELESDNTRILSGGVYFDVEDDLLHVKSNLVMQIWPKH